MHGSGEAWPGEPVQLGTSVSLPFSTLVIPRLARNFVGFDPSDWEESMVNTRMRGLSGVAVGAVTSTCCPIQANPGGGCSSKELSSMPAVPDTGLVSALVSGLDSSGGAPSFVASVPPPGGMNPSTESSSVWCDSTVVSSEDELFEGFGSSVEDETVPWLVIVPDWLAAWYTTSTVAEAP